MIFFGEKEKRRGIPLFDERDSGRYKNVWLCETEFFRYEFKTYNEYGRFLHGKKHLYKGGALSYALARAGRIPAAGNAGIYFRRKC